MLLREHPLMSYRGVSSWPPVWVWRGGVAGAGGADILPRGEIGTLKEVIPSNIEPRDRIYLINQYRGQEYMGCLLFTDAIFCAQICAVLRAHCGWQIADIGKLDVSHLA